MYERIANDENIIELFKRIEIEELNDDKFWAYHKKTHVDNVIKMTESILIQLEYDKEFIEQAKIAALLHDIGVIHGKDNHQLNSYKMTKEYFLDNNIETGNNEMILDAILNHSEGFGKNNKMAAVLMLADKLDIKKDRVAPDGYNAIGMRQLQYIDDIIVTIDKSKKLMSVNFSVSDKVDREELNNFYFIPKVFKSIKEFANENNLNSIIYFNDLEWNL